MNDENILVLDPSDNVGIALVPLVAGDTVHGIVVPLDIAQGHKLALQSIDRGSPVRKYGQVIGAATADIAAGEHVHVHNLDAEAAAAADDDGNRWPAPWKATDTAATFNGFRREDGPAGTRNYVGIIATVNCSATVVRKIVERFAGDALAAWPNVDGLVPITHTTGCGMAANSEGLRQLRRTLRGFIRQPNFGGVLVIGLGCEVNEVDRLLDAAPALAEGPTLRTMTIQAAGGTVKAIDEGVAQVRELLDIANLAVREALPAMHLTLGLQCGGSDAWSGITANPALGAAADRLVRAGGTVMLAETPEVHGAEHLLYRRATSAAVVEALRERLLWWEQYVARHGVSLNNNPSPGNIAGGISTILEKSLGAVAKSGTSPLNSVVRYAAPVTTPGFVFMDSPGYDPCSVTGEIASGANVVCFTTGRGSVFGAKPAPSIKLGSNSTMSQHMADDIDFDCGPIVDGSLSVDDAGARIFELILRIASGEQSASERNGFGDLEFVPWQIGAVL